VARARAGEGKTTEPPDGTLTWSLAQRTEKKLRPSYSDSIAYHLVIRDPSRTSEVVDVGVIVDVADGALRVGLQYLIRTDTVLRIETVTRSALIGRHLLCAGTQAMAVEARAQSARQTRVPRPRPTKGKYKFNNCHI